MPKAAMKKPEVRPERESAKSKSHEPFIQVQFDETQKEKVRAKAESLGLTMSAYVRMITLQEIEKA